MTVKHKHLPAGFYLRKHYASTNVDMNNVFKDRLFVKQNRDKWFNVLNSDVICQYLNSSNLKPVFVFCKSCCG